MYTWLSVLFLVVAVIAIARANRALFELRELRRKWELFLRDPRRFVSTADMPQRDDSRLDSAEQTSVASATAEEFRPTSAHDVLPNRPPSPTMTSVGEMEVFDPAKTIVPGTYLPQATPSTSSEKIPPIIFEDGVNTPQTSGHLPTTEKPPQPVDRASEDILDFAKRHWAAWNRKTPDLAASPTAKLRGISLEERLGAKLPVWLGAIAILLAGIFLMSFAVKQGWFTPRLRVYAASIVSILLIVGGCIVRRNYANLAQGMAAAGVGIQFAVLLAVSTIFQNDFSFITPWISLYAMVCITTLAVLLSIYLGPMVAIIGLFGGFATPALLQLDARHTTPLFACLIVQQIGTSLIGRRSGLWYFPLLAIIAVQIYVGAWMALYWDLAQAPLFGMILLAAVASFFITYPSPKPNEPTALLKAEYFKLEADNPWWAALPALILSAILISRTELSWINLSLHGVLLAGVMVFARIREPFFGLYPCAAGLSIGTLLVQLVTAEGETRQAIDERILFATVGLALILGLGCMVAIHGSRLYLAWSYVTAIALIAIGAIPHVALEKSPSPLHWLWVAAGLIGWSAVVMTVSNYSRRQLPGQDVATGSLVAAFSVLTLLAVSLFIRHEPLSLYWFAVVCGGVLVVVAGLTWAWRLYITAPILAGLAAALAISLLNTQALEETLVPELYWNQAILGFGVAIVSLVIAGFVLDKGCRGKLLPAPNERLLPQAFFALAAVLTAVMLCVLVHHGFRPQNIEPLTTQWLEISWDVIAVSFVGLLIAIIARLSRDEWMGSMADVFLIAALGTMVLWTGLIAGPLSHPIEVGQTLFFNWISFAYGIPIIIAFVSVFLRRRASASISQISRALLCIAVALFFFMHIRHGFWNQSNTMMITSFSSFHICELPTYALICGGIAGVAELLHRRFRSAPMLSASIGLAITFGALVLLIATIFSPLFFSQSVGSTPVVNLLLYIFGAPLVAAVWLVWRFRSTNHGVAMVAGMAALLLLWLLVTCEVRQYFSGPILTERTPSQDEWYAYSAAWILLAIILLSAGVATRSRLLRWGSLILMLVSVAKVFLFDTRELGDLWRVASYFGLGVSLMIVAFVYQKFVFRESRGLPGQLP